MKGKLIIVLFLLILSGCSTSYDRNSKAMIILNDREAELSNCEYKGVVKGFGGRKPEIALKEIEKKIEKMDVNAYQVVDYQSCKDGYVCIKSDEDKLENKVIIAKALNCDEAEKKYRY